MNIISEEYHLLSSRHYDRHRILFTIRIYDDFGHKEGKIGYYDVDSNYSGFTTHFQENVWYPIDLVRGEWIYLRKNGWVYNEQIHLV